MWQKVNKLTASQKLCNRIQWSWVKCYKEQWPTGQKLYRSIHWPWQEAIYEIQLLWIKIKLSNTVTVGQKLQNITAIGQKLIKNTITPIVDQQCYGANLYNMLSATIWCVVVTLWWASNSYTLVCKLATFWYAMATL
jgi:hypothetical protein